MIHKQAYNATSNHKQLLNIDLCVLRNGCSTTIQLKRTVFPLIKISKSFFFFDYFLQQCANQCYSNVSFENFHNV